MMKTKKIIENEPNMTISRKISKITQFFGVFSKYFKVSIRDKPMWFWVVGYPLLFMIIFTVGFSESENVNFEIGFVSYDSVPLEGQIPGEEIDFGAEFIMQLFTDTTNDLHNTFSPVFNITEETARKRVEAGELDGVVIFPANFSEVLYNSTDNQGPLVDIYTSPDPTIQTVISSIMEGIINQIITQREEIDLAEINLIASREEIRMFDYLMPGTVVAGVTITIMIIAQNMGREKEHGLMQRLDTTPVPRAVQLLGNGSAQIAFSFVQIAILLLCLVIFGVDIHPNANWVFIVLNLTILTIACLGIGLIIAAIVKDSNAAGGISWVVILPLQFFGDSIAVFNFGNFKRIFPTYYASKVMRSVLISGLGLSQIWKDMLINLLFGIGFLILGVIIFSKKKRV